MQDGSATMSPEKTEKALSHDGARPGTDAQIITAELPDGEYAPEYYAQKWFRKPIFQIVLVSFVCFMCPGACPSPISYHIRPRVCLHPVARLIVPNSAADNHMLGSHGFLEQACSML